MASWKYEKKNGYTYLIVRTHRGRPVSRKLYKHLDGAETHNIQSWVDQWAAQNERTRTTPAHILFSDDKLARDVAAFTSYVETGLRREPGTVKKYQLALLEYALPYFLSLGLKDPAQWPGVSIGLLPHMQEREQSASWIRDVNNALKKFWGWMQEEGIITDNVPALRLRRPPRDPDEDETPLDFTVEPDVVLEWLGTEKAQARWEVRLLALLGYFFSLRPQESMALRRGDFSAGTAATGHECARAMVTCDLYTRLAVHIHQQRSKAGKLKPPKAHSRGWVSCFDERAARLVVQLLKHHDDPLLPIFSVGNDRLFELWRESTVGTKLAGVTLKDLRRASIYHLGHHTKFSSHPILLMKHARHKEMETTMLYLRRPEEEAPASMGVLDLDA